MSLLNRIGRLVRGVILVLHRRGHKLLSLRLSFSIGTLHIPVLSIPRRRCSRDGFLRKVVLENGSQSGLSFSSGCSFFAISLVSVSLMCSSDWNLRGQARPGPLCIKAANDLYEGLGCRETAAQRFQSSSTTSNLGTIQLACSRKRG